MHTDRMNRNWNIHEMLDRSSGVITAFVTGRECSKKAEAKFDRTLDHLVQQERASWSRPKASPLGDHIYVIRFEDENRKQLRVFGHFDDKQHCFVMTLSGGEKNDTYYPSNYLDQAASNRTAVEVDFFQRTAGYDGRCDHSNCEVTAL
ncbi:MAG: hypothetical protein PHU77_00150 [Simplicispira sp.]|nr:hypothetical protein [Simplicispira sp.]